VELFVNELRHQRQAAGLSQEALAEKAGVSPSLVAMVETHRRAPTKDFAAKCDAAIGTTEGLLSRLFDQLLQRETTPKRFRPWLAVESTARTLRSYQPALVPGLLQTPDYALTVLGGDEERVAVRLERQAALANVELVAVIDECVLHRPVGGPEVMAEQVARLATGARAVVHVVPLSVGHYVGLDGAFVLADLDDGTELCLFDNLLGGEVTELRDDVACARRAWEAVRSEALSRRQSALLLKEVAEAWSSRGASPLGLVAPAGTASR
jgi:transcriptional regulator with XRE-family HTH domain